MALHRVDLHNGAMNDAQPIRPHLVARVWGGERLRALLGDTVSSGATSGPIGEAWFGAAHGDATHALVKLLDVRERLSVQVHPNDALARELHGAGEIGKHEAWVIVEAVPDATILLGRDPAVAPERLAAALRGDGAIEPLLARVPVQPGDVIDVPPGLLHALMPGLLVWEIQQPTDRTYRVADWGRDAEDRPLHRLEAAQGPAGREGGVEARRVGCVVGVLVVDTPAQIERVFGVPRPEGRAGGRQNSRGSGSRHIALGYDSSKHEDPRRSLPWPRNG